MKHAQRQRGPHQPLPAAPALPRAVRRARALRDRRVRPRDARLRAASAGAATRATTRAGSDALRRPDAPHGRARQEPPERRHVVARQRERQRRATSPRWPAWARERDPSRPLHYERDWSLPRRRRLQPHVRRRTPRSTRSAGGEEPPLDDPRWTPAAAACRSSCASTRTRWATGPAGSPSTRSCSSATRAARAASSGSGSTTASARRRRREFFAYGGDFGEPLHDGNFVADGLLFPDRTPSPGLLEFKKVFEPVRIDGDADGGLRIDEPARRSATCRT